VLIVRAWAGFAFYVNFRHGSRRKKSRGFQFSLNILCFLALRMANFFSRSHRGNDKRSFASNMARRFWCIERESYYECKISAADCGYRQRRIG
ncbi:hypothetical protein, partial [Serratia marcescens]|uniref:hypothetical protein n=1 Tax=Serratia marcescens TaxID=615 RepID=UPI003FA7EEEB